MTPVENEIRCPQSTQFEMALSYAMHFIVDVSFGPDICRTGALSTNRYVYISSDMISYVAELLLVAG